ncbi:hypothetical protein V8G54_007068 [Vigna mungo]|uniref:Uncharacterized protein n=1 Tax=Vigna mungo TaxID=3915 RepID=A0AAQ3P2R5_VIGMU
MEFIKCSVAGVAYGHGVTEVEQVTGRSNGSPILHERINGLKSKSNEIGDSPDRKEPIKGFNFTDERIMNGNWVNEPFADFFRLLAICHTAIPEVDEETGNVSYEAESPDEAAFVIAAGEVGFKFYKRTQNCLSMYELDPVSGNEVESFSCRLLRQGMKQIIIHLEIPEIQALEKVGEKMAVVKVK